MEKLYGNAVVGQSGGPTSAINATLAGVIRGAHKAISDGDISKLYGMKNGVEGLLNENLVDLGGMFIEEESLSALEHTPSAALGSCRVRLPEPKADDATYLKLLEIFKKYDIRYFFYIGGNDSMDTVDKLSRFTASVGYDMRIMGVPKTIDNDLTGTDHTPGFGSAAKYIATTMQEIVCDCSVYTKKAVTIVEIMGRDAGWLAASAALPAAVGGFAPDYVYLPERAFDMEKFFEDVRSAHEKHPGVVIAVSEGIRFADGTYVGEASQSGAVDVFGHKYLAGAARVLESAVKEKLGCKVRSVELNLPQRCAAHIVSATDIRESVGVGAAAVAYAVAGVSASMTVMERAEDEYKISYSSRAVCDIANKISQVPNEYINERGNFVTDACLDYLKPLVKGESYPEFVGGIPKYIKI
jgi:6-phosphofructokinase